MQPKVFAVTDIETTGTNPDKHEVIDIGLVLARADTLEVIRQTSWKINPKHIDAADPESLAVNGYDPALWVSAFSLPAALTEYAGLTRGSIFCSHNITFDWGFLERAFLQCGVSHSIDYHRVDLFTLAWGLLREEHLPSYRLSAVAKYLGIPQESKPHFALNGAQLAYAVLRALLSRRVK